MSGRAPPFRKPKTKKEAMPPYGGVAAIFYLIAETTGVAFPLIMRAEPECVALFTATYASY